jgi:hypothetical protein
MSATMRMIIVPVCIMSMIIMSCTIIMTRIMSTHLMKLDSIVCIIFFSIKPNMREIVPDREDSRLNQIGEKELIEHKQDSKRNDNILMC